MKTVYKYDISAEDYFTLHLPKGATPLSVQEQYGNIQLWCLVNPKNQLEKRTFRLAGTGHVIQEDNLNFIGTFQLMNGQLVFHLFEVSNV